MNAETRTAVNAFETLALLDEAVHLSHPAQCSLRPPLLLNDRLDLLTKRLDILRVRCEVEEHMREALSCGVNQVGESCNKIFEAYLRNRLTEQSKDLSIMNMQGNIRTYYD